MEADPAVAARAAAPPTVAAPPAVAARAAAPAVAAEASAGESLRARFLAGGTEGNELLTSSSGGVPLVLLAIIGLTIIQMRPLLSLHQFVGMMLIGPVALKTASTGYRFVRYYASDAEYRRKGAPPAPLRALAPIVVASTVVVFVSGVILLFAGPSSREALLPLHKVSFIAWLVFTAIHVLVHLPKTRDGLRSDFHKRAALPGTRRAARAACSRSRVR